MKLAVMIISLSPTLYVNILLKLILLLHSRFDSVFMLIHTE